MWKRYKIWYAKASKGKKCWCCCKKKDRTIVEGTKDGSKPGQTKGKDDDLTGSGTPMTPKSPTGKKSIIKVRPKIPVSISKRNKGQLGQSGLKHGDNHSSDNSELSSDSSDYNHSPKRSKNRSPK